MGRQRARLACKTCRDLKRKCDGQQPCGNCVRYEYECVYREASTLKQRARQEGLRQQNMAPPTPQRSASSPRADAQAPAAASQNETRSLEANSGATFFRRLALRLDPKSAPRLHTFAWNVFLGARKNGYVPTAMPITSIMPLATFQELALVYFQKVDPTYGFINRQEAEEHAERRWNAASPAAADPMQDAIFCGVAALGCLYSHVHAPKMEIDLVESARMILEPAISENPTVTSITAWVLRVAYLRIADTTHTAWTASCMLMHMIEAAGLHREPSSDSIMPYPQGLDLELRRRLTAVSQHLNIWTSFDMGRSRVSLCNATVAMPSKRLGDQTVELMELLPYSAELDPQKSPSTAELEAALLAVMAGVHTTPSSVLCQCNLALCLCRRLQATGASFTGKVLEQILSMCTSGIRAAQEILDARSPWHHVANVPFQIVCLLLAIDNYASTPVLKDAIACLRNVAEVYSTGATQEALRTASSLIALHIRWKEKCTSALRDVLVTIPETNPRDRDAGPVPELSDDTQWLSSLSEDLSTLPCFDIDEFMAPTFLRDETSEWM